MTASKASSASRPKLTVRSLKFDVGISVANNVTGRDNPLLSEHSLTTLAP